MNRRIRRRQHAVAAKGLKGQTRRRRPVAPMETPVEAPGVGALSLPNWRRALMTTAALTGVVGLLPLGAAAQTFTVPPTPGDDNTELSGLLDGEVADVLAGDDTLTVNTEVGVDGSATVTGGEGDDSIALSFNSHLGVNEDGAGQVLGDAGDDTITLDRSYVGNNGAGMVDGGDGADSIVLMNGSALARNAGSSGQVLGGAGNDKIFLDRSEVGFAGDATVSGGEGNDTIDLSEGGGIAVGADATGVVRGEAGNDVITLDRILTGARGAATVSGGEGNDDITLYNGSHLGWSAGATGQVQGDAGNDSIELTDTDVGYSGAGTVSGGADDDRIIMSNGNIGRNLGSYGAPDATGRILGDAGDDTISLYGVRVGYYGGGTVDGGEGDDSIVLENNTSIGDLNGSSGEVRGGAGDDIISSNIIYVGRNGAGVISGGDGNDRITMRNGRYIGMNADATGQVLGDAGNDTISLDATRVGFEGAGTVSGGEGDDVISLSRNSSLGERETGSARIMGDAGDDSIFLDDRTYVGREGAATVDGGDGDDSIELTDRSHIGANLNGSGQVLGGAGDDEISLTGSHVGSRGAATVSGGDGDDTIALFSSPLGQYAGASGEVRGDAGDDIITLERSEVGRSGDGAVFGGDGDDSIELTESRIAGTGVSGQVLGDAGNDTITINDSHVGAGGSATVSGGEGDDRIALSNASHIGSFYNSPSYVRGDAGNDTITINGSAVGRFSAGTVSGGEGDDSIVLSNGSAVGAAGYGANQVLGDAGDDTIILDRSYIAHANFGTVSTGETGTVSGGDGNDSIVLRNGSFISGSAAASGAVRGDAGDDTITIDNSTVGRSGAATVDGGDGNDSIVLVNGAEIGAQGEVLGGAGNDTVLIDTTLTRAAGAVVDAGEGVDELAYRVVDTATNLPEGAFQNFEAFRKDGAGVLTVTDAAAFASFADRATVREGVLDLSGDGALSASAVDVEGGVLRTDGGALASGADVSVASAGRFEINGDETVAALTNGGVVEIAGGSVFRTGTITNAVGGAINVGAGAMLEGTGNTLNNASTINVAAGGALVDAGDINNLADGVINFNGAGAMTAGGANGFTNAGAVNLLAGDVSIDGDVTNAGSIIFAQDALQTVTVDGDYVQAPDAVLSVNIFGDESDRLVVAGDVELAGELNIASVSGLQTGENAIRIIDAAGDVAGSFDVASGLLVDQRVATDDGNVDVVLNVTVNPVADLTGLSGNQTGVGENLFALLADPNGNRELAGLAFAIGLLDDEAAVASAFEQLHPESLDIGLKFLTASQRNFVDLMFDRALDASGDEAGPRFWGGVQAAGYNQDNSTRNIGFDGQSYDFTIGVSGYRVGRFTLGLAGSYGEYNGEGDGSLGDDIDAQIYRFAASARADIGGGGRGPLARISSVFSYAGGETDFEMSRIASSSLALTRHAGSASIDSVDWSARFTLDGFDGRRWPVSPYVEVGVGAYRQNDAMIGAGSVTALRVDALDESRGYVGIGAQYDRQLTSRMSLRARVAGVNYVGDTQNVFVSRFAAAPGDAPAFRTLGREVKRQVEFDAAWRYEHGSGFGVEAGLFGETGDLDVYGARLALSRAF